MYSIISLLPLLSLTVATITLSPFLIPQMSIEGPGPEGAHGISTPNNVTISFSILDPNTPPTANTNCSATYLPADFPQAYLSCDNHTGVAFKFDAPYDFEHFTLHVRHTHKNTSSDSGFLTTSYGSVQNIGNSSSPEGPGNYLTCIQDDHLNNPGICCHITNGSSPIPLPITTSLSFSPFELQQFSTFYPAMGSNKDFNSIISFSIIDPNHTGEFSNGGADCLLVYSSIASPPSTWTNCTGGLGLFQARVPDQPVLSVGVFEMEVRHSYEDSASSDNVTTSGTAAIVGKTLNCNTAADRSVSCSGPGPVFANITLVS